MFATIYKIPIIITLYNGILPGEHTQTRAYTHTIDTKKKRTENETEHIQTSQQQYSQNCMRPQSIRAQIPSIFILGSRIFFFPDFFFCVFVYVGHCFVCVCACVTTELNRILSFSFQFFFLPKIFLFDALPFIEFYLKSREGCRKIKEAKIKNK